MKLTSFLMSLIVVLAFAITVPVIASDVDPPQIEQSIQMEYPDAAFLQMETPSLFSLQLYADLEEKEPAEKSTMATEAIQMLSGSDSSPPEDKRTITQGAKCTPCDPIIHEDPGLRAFFSL
jgi:hypothetical protein